MKSEFDIYFVLSELSKTNSLFCSELEFQFYLAWKIKEIYGEEFKISIEYPLKNYIGKNRNIDLLLVDNYNNYIPIELKYKTSKFEQVWNGFCYKLKDQSANDLSRYGHLKDIARIEYFKNIEPNFLVGYVITITNQCKTWQKIINQNQTDYEFSLENGTTICKGIKQWTKNTSEYNKKNYPAINLENNYKINWQDYCNFNKPRGLFKILITEIKNETEYKIMNERSLKEYKYNNYAPETKRHSKVIEEIEEFLSSMPINYVFSRKWFATELSQKYKRSAGSYIPSDYCYNRENKGINYDRQPHYFLFLGKGQYQYVGKNYNFTGNVESNPRVKK